MLVSSTGVRSSNGLFFVIIVACSANASSSSSMYDRSSSRSEPTFNTSSWDAPSSNQISAVCGAILPASISDCSSSRRYFQIPRSASARTSPESTKLCNAASSIPNSAATSSTVRNFLLSMSATQCEQVWQRMTVTPHSPGPTPGTEHESLKQSILEDHDERQSVGEIPKQLLTDLTGTWSPKSFLVFIGGTSNSAPLVSPIFVVRFLSVSAA